MVKHSPRVNAPEWREPQRAQQTKIEIEIITPLFGGGYQTRECDTLIPVRAASVRGHLRFWWRATAGAQYSSVDELYCHECDLWGEASTPEQPLAGKVAVRVEILNKGTSKLYKDIAPRPTAKEGPLHGFFLFPFQAIKSENLPEAKGLEGVQFRLCLQYDSCLNDEQRREVEAAVKAWLVFGGIGARTRRGCGALKATKAEWQLSNNPNQREEFIRRLLFHQGGNHAYHYPTLVGATIIIGQTQQDAIAVWRELGRFWAQFRKGQFPGNYNPMSAGQWNDYRQVLCKLPTNPGASLPLAKPYLGLPIVYQKFQGACFHGTIEPAQSGRMASPVILKPVALDNGQFAPLILVMRTKKPERIKINNREYSLQSPTSDPVLKALQASDVLDAVIKAAEQQFAGVQKIQL
jgi:CRISPR-associated protein Cmr1